MFPKYPTQWRVLSLLNGDFVLPVLFLGIYFIIFIDIWTKCAVLSRDVDRANGDRKIGESGKL